MSANGSKTLRKREPLPLHRIKVVIFDMDELMIDSTLVHEIVFEKVLYRYGISTNDPKNPLTNEEFNKLLLQTHEKNIQTMPGLSDLVGVCKSKGYKLAVASSAKKLGVNPRDCLVLEDAMNGVKSAKAASMIVLGVHNKFTYQRLGVRQDLHVADLEVESLDDVRSLFSSAA